MEPRDARLFGLGRRSRDSKPILHPNGSLCDAEVDARIAERRCSRFNALGWTGAQVGVGWLAMRLWRDATRAGRAKLAVLSVRSAAQQALGCSQTSQKTKLMARVPRWTSTREDGVFTVRLKKWRWFDDFLREFVLNNTNYIFRGHACAAWRLESTLDRLLRNVGRLEEKGAREHHLENFRLAARGRRGAHAPELGSDNDWWALGQHHGLATPLLDWTRSPYVAAYFAYAPQSSPGTEQRVVFALQESIVTNYCNGGTYVEGFWGPLRPPNGNLGDAEKIETCIPYSNENARLVSQNGLFTRGPDGEDMEAWIRRHFAGVKKGILVKVLAPESDRINALRALNRMNINHLTLFPDLFGSSRHCNLAMSIPNY